MTLSFKSRGKLHLNFRYFQCPYGNLAFPTDHNYDKGFNINFKGFKVQRYKEYIYHIQRRSPEKFKGISNNYSFKNLKITINVPLPQDAMSLFDPSQNQNLWIDGSKNWFVVIWYHIQQTVKI